MRDAWTPLEDFIVAEMQRPNKLMRLRMAAFAAQGLEPLIRFLFEEEAACRERLDVYCRRRAKGEAHQEWSDAVNEYWFRQRLLCIGDTVGILSATPLGNRHLLPSPPRLWSEADVLEWALVSLWHRRFDHWIKLDAVKQVTGLPFYGLDPAD